MPNRLWEFKTSIILMIFMAFASACGTVETSIQTQIPTVSENVPDTQPPAQITPENLVTETTSVNEEKPEHTAEPTLPSVPADPLAGITYGTKDGFYLINWQGQFIKLIDHTGIFVYPDAVLSPDNRQVVFSQGDPEDLWLLDLGTGETHNLTNTSDLIEHSPEWWSVYPDKIFFNSVSVAEPGMGGGLPAVINLNGSGYHVLNDMKGGPIALSPDGTIAFGCCDGPGVLERLDAGQTEFHPEDYGISARKLFIPAWSPSGEQLAWLLGGDTLGPGLVWGVGLGVFDLQNKQVQILHNYAPQGGGEVPFYLTWSPDGAWIAFVTYSEVVELGRAPALWVTRPDGSEEYFLGSGYNPIWSPDGKYLVFNQNTGTPPIDLGYIVEADKWDSLQQLPFSGEIKSWNVVNP